MAESLYRGGIRPQVSVILSRRDCSEADIRRVDLNERHRMVPDYGRSEPGLEWFSPPAVVDDRCWPDPRQLR